MNYDLALKLKNAGFQQKINESMLYSWETGGNGEQIPVEAYAPTLSELIEACGDDLQEIYHDIEGGNIWYAFEYGGKGVSNGSTPEEAVANLWLALNS